MAFREVDVVEIGEVLQGWLDGGGLRTIAERAGVDRKTARRYVVAAQAAGLVRDAGQPALCNELIGAVVERVRKARPNGHGAAWEALTACRADITGWVKDGKTLVKIEELLARSGTVVPYRGKGCGQPGSGRSGQRQHDCCQRSLHVDTAVNDRIIWRTLNALNGFFSSTSAGHSEQPWASLQVGGLLRRIVRTIQRQISRSRGPFTATSDSDAVYISDSFRDTKLPLGAVLRFHIEENQAVPGEKSGNSVVQDNPFGEPDAII